MAFGIYFDCNTFIDIPSKIESLFKSFTINKPTKTTCYQYTTREQLKSILESDTHETNFCIEKPSISPPKQILHC